MNKNRIRTIARTGILLAVVIVLQLALRSIPYNNFIVGPLVNMCLLVAALTAGIEGGIAIALLSPFTSLVNNNAPIATALLPFAPVIAISNVIFILAFYFLYNKNKYIGIAVSSAAKFGFLYFSIRIFLDIFSFPKFSEKLISLFSFPQLLTALIGGIIALPIIAHIKKLNKSNY